MKNDQYYTREPSSASAPAACAFLYRGHSFAMRTDAGVFSKGALDDGTRLLLDALPELSGDVLDLGCGWGPIGIAVKKTWPGVRVTMADVNLRALELARHNAASAGVEAEILESDGFSALAGRSFDCVITNPPIRAGKQVIYRMFADAAKALREDGALWLVIRKQQGADSAEKHLKTIFADVSVQAKAKGYRVYRAAEPLKGASEDAV